MEQIWLAIIAMITALVGGLLAILKVRETNKLSNLVARVEALELERSQNLKVITTLQNQNVLLRREGVELRRLLKKYEAAAHESLIVTDESGVIVEWDAAASLMFGYSADEAVGQDVAMLIVPPELRQRVRMAMANVFKFKRQPRMVPVKTRGVCKVGEQIDVEVQLLPGWEMGEHGSWRYGAKIRKLTMPSPDAISPTFAPARPTDIAAAPPKDGNP